MSLVGPRPLPLRDYVQLEDWHRKRYLVLPGMTGLWQVSGRIELTFDDLVRLDFYYLENWSIWLDISILAKTLPAVLARRGAYLTLSSSTVARLRTVSSTTVIVVAFNSGDALTRCLDSLAGEDVVVVNNGARGPELADAERRARVIDAENAGFGAGCNRGARETAADVLVFVNPDTVVQPGAVAALARALEQPDVAVVQARLRLLNDPEQLNSSGNVVHVSGLAWPGGYGDPADALTLPQEIAYASGAAFAIRRDLFHELGGFTEELFLYQEDLELCWRAHLRGLRVLVDPGCRRAARLRPRAAGAREGVLPRAQSADRRLLGLLRPPPAGCSRRCSSPSSWGIALVAWRQGWLREKARGWAWLVRESRLARDASPRDPGASAGGRPRRSPGSSRRCSTRGCSSSRRASRSLNGARFRVVARCPRLPLTLPSTA